MVHPAQNEDSGAIKLTVRAPAYTKQDVPQVDPVIAHSPQPATVQEVSAQAREAGVAMTFRNNDNLTASIPHPIQTISPTHAYEDRQQQRMHPQEPGLDPGLRRVPNVVLAQKPSRTSISPLPAISIRAFQRHLSREKIRASLSSQPARISERHLIASRFRGPYRSIAAKHWIEAVEHHGFHSRLPLLESAACRKAFSSGALNTRASATPAGHIRPDQAGFQLDVTS